MSSLVHLPSGKTFDYWWDRLRGRRFRKRFLATKVIEVVAYKTTSSRPPVAPVNLVASILQMKPVVTRNRIDHFSNPAVVIPVRCTSAADTALLLRLLANLQQQNAKVIVINDGSPYWPDLPPRIQVLSHAQTKGPAAARNTGIQAALAMGANPILMIDSDCVPNSDWVAQATQGFIENPYIHAISGNTISLGGTWFDKYHDLNGTLNGRRFKGTNILLYGPTCNLAISRTVAEKCSFDETYKKAACEDIDFCYRVMEAGFRITHRSTMMIQHDFQFQPGRFMVNVLRFIRQFKKYASAESALLGKFPAYHPHFARTEEISSEGFQNMEHATIPLETKN